MNFESVLHGGSTRLPLYSQKRVIRSTFSFFGAVVDDDSFLIGAGGVTIGI